MSPLANPSILRGTHFTRKLISNQDTITPIILAGGLGTRLRSVVENCPKVLAEVSGRPFLYHLLDQLATANFSQVVLLTGYLGEQVATEVGHSYRQMQIAYSQESEPLGTAGALRLARHLVTTPTVLLLNGDSYCDVPFDALIESHHRESTDLTMTVYRAEDASRFGVVALNENQRVIRFCEKQSTTAGWINAGISLMSTHLLDDIPEPGFVSLERDLLPKWVHEKCIRGFPTNGTFIDIGTPESFAKSQFLFTQSTE